MIKKFQWFNRYNKQSHTFTLHGIIYKVKHTVTMLHSTTVNLYRKRIQSNQENCIQEKTEYEGLGQRFTSHWVWAGHVAKNRE